MEETIHLIKESKKLEEGVELAKLLADRVGSEFEPEEIDGWESHNLYEYLDSFGYEWDGYLGWVP